MKIKDQTNIGRFTDLLLDEPKPMKRYSRVLIDGNEYIPEIVYDSLNSIAIPATDKNLIGKEVIFQ